jgi:hypothetical protein
MSHPRRERIFDGPRVRLQLTVDSGLCFVDIIRRGVLVGTLEVDNQERGEVVYYPASGGRRVHLVKPDKGKR